MTTVEDGPENAVAEDRKWLDARPSDAAGAREAVGAYLDLHGPALSAAARGDILLVVSELVTNALRHAGGVTGLRIVFRDGTVEITVQDASPEWPAERGHAGDWTPGGFGWPLVRRLAEVTVTALGDDGKLVRATMRGDGPA
jgi:anti-sigma regulatory factor (Ser/Thr protein kinase)